MVQQGETDLSLILALGTSGMLVLAIFIVVFIVLYQKKQIRQQLTHQHDLLGATIQTQEKERQRFARDLHDGAGGTLSAAKLSINQAIRASQDHASNQFLVDAKKLIDETLVDTRRISHDLLPATLSEFGLADALDEHCLKLNSSGLEITFQHVGEKGRFRERTELAIFRIIQELVENGRKHAEATHIWIKCHVNGNLVSVEVEDNGKGFNITEVQSNPKTRAGLGLKNIESRVNMLNANIVYDSVIGKGTKVTLTLDISQDQIVSHAQD